MQVRALNDTVCAPERNQKAIRVLENLEKRPILTESYIDRKPMGSIKKRRKAKINKHKRRKKLRLNRHKKRTWQQ